MAKYRKKPTITVSIKDTEVFKDLLNGINALCEKYPEIKEDVARLCGKSLSQ